MMTQAPRPQELSVVSRYPPEAAVRRVELRSTPRGTSETLWTGDWKFIPMRFCTRRTRRELHGGHKAQSDLRRRRVKTSPSQRQIELPAESRRYYPIGRTRPSNTKAIAATCLESAVWQPPRIRGHDTPQTSAALQRIHGGCATQVPCRVSICFQLRCGRRNRLPPYTRAQRRGESSPSAHSFIARSARLGDDGPSDRDHRADVSADAAEGRRRIGSCRKLGE